MKAEAVALGGILGRQSLMREDQVLREFAFRGQDGEKTGIEGRKEEFHGIPEVKEKRIARSPKWSAVRWWRRSSPFDSECIEARLEGHQRNLLKAHLLSKAGAFALEEGLCWIPII